MHKNLKVDFKLYVVFLSQSTETADLHQEILQQIPVRMTSKIWRGPRAGFNWWEAWGPVYLGGTERLQQLYD